MKKVIKIIVVVLVVLLIILLGFYYGYIYFSAHANKYINKSNPITEYRQDYILEIERDNKNCVPMVLKLFDDKTYELYTDYHACKPMEVCLLMLKYTKSTKGTYDYDLSKILSTVEEDNGGYTNDNVPEYVLYTQDDSYIVKHNQTNQYINELLKQLDIDMNQCANANY